MVRFKNRYLHSVVCCSNVLTLCIYYHAYRYFLVELRFQDDLKHKGLSSITPKSLAHDVRQAMKAFFGDYGLATVQNSLSGIISHKTHSVNRADIRSPRRNLVRPG